MTKFVNLTADKINIYGKDRKLLLSIEPENVPAKCYNEREICGYVGEIPVYHVKYWQVLDIPLPKENTVYIVDEEVAKAVQRADVYYLGREIYDKNDHLIGYEGLQRT